MALVVVAAAVLFGLWAAIEVSTLAVAGRGAGTSVGDALVALPHLVADPGTPSAAWNGQPRRGVPGVHPLLFWPVATVSVAATATATVVALRVVFGVRIGTERRHRLGVATNARLARRRDLDPIIVDGPTEGRLIIGRVGSDLVATENRTTPTRTRRRWPLTAIWNRGRDRGQRRHGDRSAVAVIGPARSGKTATIIAGVLDWQGPAILSSVRDDLFTRTVAARRAIGEVFVFDPLNELSDLGVGVTRVSWSPLARADNVSGAMEAAAVLQEAAPLEGTTNATYWSKKGEALLWPVLYAAAVGGRSMADVVRWLAVQDGNQYEPDPTPTSIAALAGLGGLDGFGGGGDVGDGEGGGRLGGEIRSILRSVIADGAFGDALQAQHALAQFDGFWELDPRTRSDIYSTAQTLVQPWEDPYVSFASSPGSGPTIDLVSLMAGRNTLYVVQPLRSATRFAVVFGGLLGSLLKDQAYQASHHYQAPIPDLLTVIDEAGNTPVQWLPSVASTCAGVGVLLVTIWQSYAQIEAIYQRQAAPLVTNHGTKVFFAGISDKPTLDYITGLVGDEDVTQRSATAEVTLTRSGSRSISEATQQRALLPADVLRQIPNGEGLLIHGTLPPAHITGQRYWLDRRLQTVAAGNGPALDPWVLPPDLVEALRARTAPPPEVLAHLPAYDPTGTTTTAPTAGSGSGTGIVPRALGWGADLGPGT